MSESTKQAVIEASTMNDGMEHLETDESSLLEDNKVKKVKIEIEL